VGETQLREAERRHLVRDERPLPGEAVRRGLGARGVVAGFEGDHLVGELQAEGLASVVPPRRITPTPPRGDQAHAGERNGERDEAQTPPLRTLEGRQLSLRP